MAGTVAAYYSMSTEPDTHGLIYALWKRGTYVLLPVLLAGGDLDWASYAGPDSLRPGPRGLTEPAETPRETPGPWHETAEPSTCTSAASGISSARFTASAW